MQTKPRTLWLEALEDRCVPAGGTVTVAGWGLGNVNLVGDANANDITVNLSPNGINITGNNGTTLTLTPPRPLVGRCLPVRPLASPSCLRPRLLANYSLT